MNEGAGFGIEADEVIYIPTKTALQFHNDNSLVRAVMGPVGSGKSSMAAMEILLRAFNQNVHKGVRRSRWLAVRNTFNELKTTTIKTLMHWMPASITHVNANYPPIAKLKTTLPDGTLVDLEVLFLALDQTRDLGKLRSLELTGVWLNEATELEKEVLEFAIQRRGRYPAKVDGGFNWSGVIMDYNPPSEDHWLHDLFERDPLPSYKLFKQPAAIVQMPKVTPEGVTVEGEMMWVGSPDAENIENHVEGFDYYFVQVPGKSDEWIKVFMQGQYGQSTSGRAVYASEWSDSEHVSKAAIAPDKYLPVVVGFDWGLNPAAVFGQLSRVGSLVITDELFLGVDTSLEEFIDVSLLPLIDDRYRGCRIEGFGDPAGLGRSPLDKRTPFMLINKIGIACRPARTNDFLPRRDAVTSFLLRRKGFLLAPHCKQLREGFNRGYRFARMQTTGLTRPRPEKNAFSHLHDALQYLSLGVKSANLYSGLSRVAAGGSKGTSF
jgi:hypothetical protein